ncbi:MAG: hypothetical protein HGA28_04140 [Anaerolineaceae bacterium]|nr:hypothetical protein [Anaerolineaceae bacterium]
MTEILPLLIEMISAPGISGDEARIRPLIEQAWEPLTDKLSVSRLGSLHGFQQGTGPEPRPSILVAAHMDAIGLMVNAIIDGFLRVISIGGIDMRVLPGQMVTVHGHCDLPGMIVPTPTRLLPYSLQNKVEPQEYLLVDVGFGKVGQKAEVKVETFPFTRYGTIPGTVTFVSNDAVQDPKRGPTFQVRVKLDRGSLMVDQREVNLSPGMAVSAEVMTDKRRVIAYLLDPVRRTTNESFREK